MNKKTIGLLLLVILALLVLLMPAAPPHGDHSYGQAQIGGAYTLTDTHGTRVSNTIFNGKLTLVYLGYTHCPDICPATLASLSGVLKKLGVDADKVAVVFISLDPAHDTPQVLADYLKAFDPRIIGLTGNETEIRQVIREFKAYATTSQNTAPGNMLISHSGLLYLLGKDGQYLRHFETGASEDAIIAALKESF